MSELSPSQFFGRARVTRQALKTKTLSSSKEYVNQEVITGTKGRKVPLKVTEVEVRKGRSRNIPEKKSESICPVKRAKKTADEDTKNKKTKKLNEDKNKISKHDEVESDILKKRENFIGPTGKNGETSSKEAAPSGPVYRNARMSEVFGDPYALPRDENSTPVKKKKPRKINPKKATGARVDYFKHLKGTKGPLNVKCQDPINKKPDACKNGEKKDSQLKFFKTSKVITSSKAVVSKGTVSSVGHSDELDEPAGCYLSVVEDSKVSNVKCPSRTVMTAQNVSRLSSPIFRVGNQVTSTPVPNSIAAASRKDPQNSTPTTSCIKSRDVVVVRLASKGPSLASTSSHAAASTPLSSAIGQQKTTPVITKKNSQTVPNTGGRGLPPIALRIDVRQSPSFKEPEPTTVSPPSANFVSSSHMPDTPCSKDSEATVPTPLKRLSKAAKPTLLNSTPTVHFAALSPSPSLVTCSPVPISDTPARSSWNSSLNVTFPELSDVIPDSCKVSLPTRMFSTHRGTIFAPDKENNVTRRKLPVLSPKRTDHGPRVTAVKFSVPKPTISDADQFDSCFGFDDEDDIFIPEQKSEPSLVKATGPRTLQTKDTQGFQRHLPIQDIQALLMGHTRPTTSQTASKNLSVGTPRSVQTKLTDFVSSTPTSTPSRSPKEKPDVLTPTPVPLFGEELLNDDLPSPFIHQSRRSYDRFRPVKRIACGDEVHSDDECEEATQKEVPKPTVMEKKKNKSYKKKKKPQDIQLDSWAHQLASHFDEVEEVALEIE